MRAATFTTYLNAQTDPGLEQAFARQAQIATSSYATISRAAELAQRQTANLLGGRGAAGLTQGNQQIQQRATALNATAAAAANAERASTRVATASRREGNEVAYAARQQKQLAASLGTTATALNVVSGRLDPVSSRVTTLSRAVTELTGLQLGLAAFGATAFALGRTANTYANLEARVRPFFETQVQVNAAMRDIAGIAQRSRAALEPVVDVYTRLTTVGQGIGLSTSRIARLTEISTKATNLGGGSAQARDAALMQFGQALSGDFKAAGQELNSLREQAPILFQAILKGYKDVDGTIGITMGRLRELAEKGQLSTEKVLEAVERSAAFIDQMAARVPNTLGKAGTEFASSITLSIGRFDQAIGLTSTLADGISVVAQNLNAVIGLALGVGVAFTAIKLGRLVTEAAAVTAGIAAQSRAVDDLKNRRQTAASASLAFHKQELRARQLDRQAIQEEIQLLNRQRQAADRDITRSLPDPANGYAGSPRRVSAALEERNRATRGMIEAGERLRRVDEALVTSGARASAAQESLARATEHTRGRFGALRAVGGSLVSFLGGGWGIAFAAATTAVYLLSTAQSQAEIAVGKHEDAQRSLAAIVDQTTGKVYDQIEGLQKLAVQRKLTDSGQDNAALASRARGEFTGFLRQFARPVSRSGFGRAAAGEINPVTGEIDPATARRLIEQTRSAPRTPAQQRLAKLLDDLDAGRAGSFTRINRELPQLAKQIPGLSAGLPRAGELAGSTTGGDDGKGSGFLGSYNRFLRDRAGQRLVAGTARPGDLELSRGEERRTTTGTGSGKPRTTAQIDADARAQAAQTEVQRARAELAQVKAGGKTSGESDDQYQTRLAAAYRAVTDAVNGEAAARRGAAAGRAQERKDAAQARRDAAEAERERREAARNAAQEKRDTAQQDLEEQAPTISRQEYLDRRLEILATFDDEINAVREAGRESNSADRQRISDAREVAAVRREVGVEFENQMAVQRLVLLGQEDEAEALRRTLDYRRRIGDEADSLQPVIAAQLRQEREINDAIASRERIVQTIRGALDSARDTSEEFFTSIQTGTSPINAFKSAFRDFQTQFARIRSRELVEKLFAGSDAKLRALLEGKSSVDQAIDGFGSSVDALSTQTTRGETALDRFATAAEGAADRLDNAQPSSSVSGSAASLAPLTGSGIGGLLGAIGAQVSAGLIAADRGVAPQPGVTDPENGDIVVTGRRTAPVTPTRVPLSQGRTPSAAQVYNQIGGTLFSGLDRILGTGAGSDRSLRALVKQNDAILSGNKAASSATANQGLFQGIGKAFGTALQGAGEGAIASGFAKALGIKQSQTGAQIGGAIGSFLPIPGGSIIGGLVGGTIGGLFKKTPSSSSTIQFANGELSDGKAVGTTASARAAATGQAKSVADGLASIAEALGADITSGGSVSIGTRKDKFVVDPTGKGRTKGAGVLSFKTEQEAIEAAIRDALGDGVISGISEASKRILRSGQDLQKALNKATAIESIPKRLLQLTDPAKFAVTELNEEFERLIRYLQEGGATAEQFAEAQKLYDLERARALESASATAVDQITQFLKDMVAGSSSPLNKRTTLQNAATDLDKFRADINAGKTVDQGELLNAARNFQDASRALNGSSKAFFDDFEMLRSLLSKARDNAGVTPTVTNLPASPFANDNSVTAAIASLTGQSTAATAAQTDVLAGKLDKLIDAVQSSYGLSYSGGGAGSAGSIIGSLPGFSQSIAVV